MQVPATWHLQRRWVWPISKNPDLKLFVLKSSVAQVEKRMTGMAASNALGDKMLMFVIGKSATPKFFKHVRNLPCWYRAQKKRTDRWNNFWRIATWTWLHKFKRQGRKIIMINDNCNDRPEITGLKRFCHQITCLVLNLWTNEWEGMLLEPENIRNKYAASVLKDI